LKYSKILSASALSVFLLQGCNDDNDTVVLEPVVPPNTIVDVAVANGNFTTLVTALQATGLDEALANPDINYTVFAPTDEAFALLGEEAIAELLADTDKLTNILTYHVISSEVNAAAATAAAGTTVEMLNENSVGLSLSGNDILVNASTVIAPDVMASNGIIHAIDAVLMPPSMNEPTGTIVDVASGDDRFSTLVAALGAADLVGALSGEGPFTVFAPTNAAFDLIASGTIDSLLADQEKIANLLKQHVVDGEVNSAAAYAANGTNVTTLSMAEIGVNINTTTDALSFGAANIIQTDIHTTNGIIHVIDAVILDDAELPVNTGSIVDIALSNPEFSTLVTALTAADLVGTLADLDEEFTVFAPTNAAFDNLPAGTLDSLLADTATLKQILLYHVFGGNVLSDSAINIARSMENTVPMKNDVSAALSFVDNMLFVNGANVSAANITAENGVIHVIDNVILPPAMTEPTMNIAEIAVSMPETFSTLVAALTAADLVDTVSDETAVFTVFAPTNDAFADIDADVLDALLADTEALSAVLLTHVVGEASLSSVDAYSQNGKSLTTASGEMIDVKVDAETGALMIGGATVVIKDVQATNGTIHVIDTVIM
jgi:uncharacterized surface protein with fasciclin (FAS1) repeats